MFEKVIENWLIKANERSFQKPFCYMLTEQGHRVIHLTRHSAMEMGKDVLSVDQDGTPCAFQLKSCGNGRFSLSDWKQIHSQILALTTQTINHPSIDSSVQHRSFLVINGEFEEEAQRAISEFNLGLQNQGLTAKLETIVIGQMLDMAKKLGFNLWLEELYEMKLLLDFLSNDGNGLLPKDKLSSLLESVYGLGQYRDESKKTSGEEKKRRIASAALLTGLLTSPYSDRKNYFAQFEAWMMYILSTFAFIEKNSISKNEWEVEINLAQQIAFSAIGELCKEIEVRKNFFEGDTRADTPSMCRIRLTLSLGTMAAYHLYSRLEPEAVVDEQINDKIPELLAAHASKAAMFGEYAIPYFLSVHWAMQKTYPKEVSLLVMLISGLIHANHAYSELNGFPNPYYTPEELLPSLLGIAEFPIDEKFTSSTYALKALIDILIRTLNDDARDVIAGVWRLRTRISDMEFRPDVLSDFYLWKNIEGTTYIKSPKHTQSWKELKEQADDSSGELVPETIKNYPILYLAMLLVYPHRLNASGVRWLDARLI